MKQLIILFSLSVLSFNCKNIDEETLSTEKPTTSIVGEWDNFQQYWLENTAEAKHRTETDDKHRHFNLVITSQDHETMSVEIREGRNAKHFIKKISLPKNIDTFKINGDTLFVNEMTHFKNSEPYKFIRTRKFSGWIEYPLTSPKDSIYHQGNLEIHDQGGMAELDIEGVDYTVELTQLLFAHKLPIMKLAIYDVPLDSVGINSRSISYTWLNPQAKRTGINLRKVITGWTLIEPGFVNQNTWRKEKK